MNIFKAETSVDEMKQESSAISFSHSSAFMALEASHCMSQIATYYLELPINNVKAIIW